MTGWLLSKTRGRGWTLNWGWTTKASRILVAPFAVCTALATAFAAPALADPPTGLVASYGFEEGSGALVADTSGEGNDGFISGAAWTSGKYGKGLSFDGVDDSVAILDAPSIDVPSSLTVSAWVRPADIEGRSQLVLVKERGTTSATYLLEADSTNSFPAFALRPSGWFDVGGASTLPENAWSHLAGTWDGTTMKLYVDGDLVDSGSATGPILTSDKPLRIGGTAVFGGSEYFEGLVDEVRVYDHALTEGEIESDMAVSVYDQTESDAEITPPDDLVAAYGFDEGTGSTVADASGEANNGAISGASWTAGHSGGALSFDGTDDRVVVADNASLDLSSGLTLEAWVKPDTNNGDWRTVIMKEPPSDVAYGLYSSAWTFNSSRPLFLIDDHNDYVLSGSASLPTGQWSHLAGTYSGSTLRVYVDGQLVATRAASRSLPNTTGPLSIGGNDTWDEYFDGLIDEVRVYNRALTPAEIANDVVTSVDEQMGDPPTIDVAPAISGDAVDGETLSATTGTWSGTGPFTYSYQWRRCDGSGASCSDIGGATASTRALVPADVDHTLRVVVTAKGPAGEDSATSQATPVVSGFSASIAGTPRNGEQLTAQVGTWRGLAPVVYKYQWQRCDATGASCADVTSARWRTYQLSTGDMGHTMRVVISAGPLSTQPTRSAATAVVVERLPERDDLPPLYGYPMVGRTLTTSEAEWEPDSATLAYQWLRCDASGEECDPIDAENSPTYDIQTGDVGATLRVTVTATTSGGSATETSLPSLEVTNRPLENTVAPSVSQAPGSRGSVLVGDVGTWTGAGPISYRVQWLRCDSEGDECDQVTGETADTYDLQPDDIGARLRFRVTAEGSAGSDTVSSAASVLIADSAPTNTTGPTVDGPPEEGQTLMGGHGEWNGVGPLDFAYQWERCDELGANCAAIDDADAPEYTLAGADVGATIRLKVTATNQKGSVAAISAVSDVVAAVGPGPVLVTPPAISGEPESGEELAVTTGSWTGATDYAYQWERCDATGQVCEILWDEGDPTLALTDDDVGSVVRVEVFAYTTDGAASSVIVATSQSIRAEGGPANTSRPTISGDLEEDATLTASPGSWTTTPPVTYAYRWQRCDLDTCTDIDGATADWYTLVKADVQRTVRVVVTAEDAKGETTAVSTPTGSIGAVSPFNEEAPSVSGDALVGETMTADPGQWDGDATITYAYQWRRCDSAGAACADISGEDGSTYELVSADAGNTVRVVVTATNGKGTLAKASSPSAPISDADGPEVTVAPTVTGAAFVAEELRVDPGEWSPTPVSFDYQWQRCNTDAVGEDCESIDGAITASYVPGHADAGHVLRVAVTANGATDSTVALAGPTDVVGPDAEDLIDQLRNVEPPSIVGEADEHVVLEADPGIWASYSPVSFEYRWQRCSAAGDGCQDIEDETEPEYRLASEDVGATVRVIVVAINTDGRHAVRSAPTAVVSPSAPLNLEPPAVDGTPVDGETLVSVDGDWVGVDDLQYQWRRCDAAGANCGPIEDATDWRYDLISDDVGATIRIRVTASNAEGSAAADSAATTVVAARKPEADGLPQIAGDPLQDATLEADPGPWSGTPAISFDYQWRRCDAAGENCSDISGATNASYVVVSGDVTATLRVSVTVSNAAGEDEAVSDPIGPIGPPEPPVADSPTPTIEGEPFDGRELVADPGGWLGLTPFSYTYQWQRCDGAGANCKDIVDATEREYTTVSGDLSAKVRVAVTATNASGSDVAYSDPTDLITSAAVANLWEPSITGDNLPGATLTAAPGGWSGSGPLMLAYQWQSCDEQGDNCQDITGEDEPEYEVQVADSRLSVRVMVTATGSLGSDSAPSEATEIRPARPVNDTPPAVSGTAVVGEFLDATPGEWTPEADEYLVQWQRCTSAGDSCVDVSGETSDTYELTLEDAGLTVRAVVTAQNDGDLEPPQEASATTGVVNTEWPHNLAAPELSTTTPVVGEGVEATTGSWVGLPPIGYEYQWELCPLESGACSEIPDATSATYVPTAMDEGWRLRVAVTAENASGSTWPARSEISEAVADGPPVNHTPPALYGDAVVGGDLEVDRGEWTGASKWRYEWRRCDELGEDCEAVPDATALARRSTVADLGKTLRVAVTGYSDLGEETVLTEPSEVVGPAAEPANVAQPTIDGDAEVGETLDGSPGEWSGTPTLDFWFVWQRCDDAGHACVAIPGAENGFFGSSYGVRRADVGSRIRLQTTTSNGWGSASAASDPTAVVPPAPALANVFPPTLPLWFFDRASYGEAYDIESSGVWVGDPEIASQWQRCDPMTADPITEEMDCSDIPDATDPSEYVPQQADIGFHLRLKETATVPGDSEIAYSDPTEGVVDHQVTDEDGLITGPAIVGETITADSTVVSEADLPITTNYEFLRVNPNQTTVQLQDGPSPSYEITGAELGYPIRVVMDASVWRADEAEIVDTRQVIVTTAAVDAQPTNAVLPSIDGDSWQGATLVADPGEWDGGGDLEHAFEWQRCDELGANCTAISEATASEYVVAAEDVEQTLRIEITASNGPASASATSAATAEITVGDAPVNTLAPTVTGDLVELETVTADSGEWSGSAPFDFTYQWLSCSSDDDDDCFEIPDETSETLELQSDVVGEWIRVDVTATNAAGTSTERSDIVGPIESAGSPELLKIPSLSVLGPPEDGSTLLTDGGAWANVADDSLEYRWQRCGPLGVLCEDIENADEPSYELTEEDVGSRLRVTVEAANFEQVLHASSEVSPLIQYAEGSAANKMVGISEDRETLYLGPLGEPEPAPLAGCDAVAGTNDCKLYRPRISPNLKLIAVEHRGPGVPRGEGTIVLLNYDGTNARPIATGSDPAWSPDGTELLMTAADPGEPGETRIVRIKADGSNALTPEPLISRPGSEEAPDLASNGTLVFAGSEPGSDRKAIYIANEADPHSSRKVDTGAHLHTAFDPRIARKDRLIYFSGAGRPPTKSLVDYGSPDAVSVWAMDYSGRALRVIARNTRSRYSSPAVAADGFYVVRWKVGKVFAGPGEGSFLEDPTLWWFGSDEAEGELIGPAIVVYEPDVAQGASDRTDYGDCRRGNRTCLIWRDSNRRKTSGYAQRYAKEPNPAYRYYDDGGDCTNFVSQAWAAGGHKRMREYERGEHSWWYSPDYVTESWRLVEHFVWQQVVESRRAWNYGDLMPKLWREGDIVVFDQDNDDVFEHLAIVTKIGPVPQLSQHSTNRRNSPWTAYIERIEREHGKDWDYFVIRPMFRGANIPVSVR